MLATTPSTASREDWLAELTEAAYRSVLASGFRGSFLDLELSLWQAIRQVDQRTAAPDPVPLDQLAGHAS